MLINKIKFTNKMKNNSNKIKILITKSKLNFFPLIKIKICRD